MAQRSGYRADLVGRTLRTGAALNQLAFGRAEDALQLSLRLHRMHARVRGTVIARESHAQPYRANAPELMACPALIASLRTTSTSAPSSIK